MTEALIVIDVQESFRARPLWQTLNNPDLIPNVQRLVDHARNAGHQVIWVLHSEPGSGGTFDPANGHVRLMDELAPAGGEPTLIKFVHNAFTTTDLHHRLVINKTSKITVCGLRTEQCVETTARVASDLGYEVTYVTDATGTFPIPHWAAPEDRSVAELLADPRTLASEDIVARTEYALAGRFATIRTTAEVEKG